MTATPEVLRSAKALIVAGNPPIGFARLNEFEGNAHLEQLSVISKQVRKGIGKKLLEEADGQNNKTIQQLRS